MASLVLRLIGCSVKPSYVSRTCVSTHNLLLRRGLHEDGKASIFKLIPNTVNDDECYNDNVKYNSGLEEKYNQLLSVAQASGGEKAIERHTLKNKKILAKERLSLLFDDADDVLELSTLAGLGMPYGDIAKAGIITAIGRIRGVHCIVVANDATVKAGTMYPITIKKQLRAQEIAQINHIPIIYVVDSGGAFLPLQADIFTQGGRGFYNEAILNSKGIPQLAVVCGSCTAGAAYIPTMSQEAIIVDKIGTIFLAGPPLVLAALGEAVSPENLGGATMHSSISGCTDYFSGTEEEAFETSRDVVTTFNIQPPKSESNYDEPLYDIEDLLGIIPKDDQHTIDMYQVIARLVDGSRFHEFKTMFGTTLVTGFAFLQGHLVGIVGNNGTMTQDAALKGSHFVQMCSQRNVPLVFLQNSTTDSSLITDVGRSDEWAAVGQTMRAHGQLMSSVSCASVPKYTVIIGNSIGLNNYMMCGRSMDPRFVFVWPNAKTCMVDPKDASLYRDEHSSHDDILSNQTEIIKNLEDTSSAFHSTSNVWDDGMILPRQTRHVLGRCLEIVKQVKGVDSLPTEYGVIRM